MFCVTVLTMLKRKMCRLCLRVRSTKLFEAPISRRGRKVIKWKRWMRSQYRLGSQLNSFGVLYPSFGLYTFVPSWFGYHWVIINSKQLTFSNILYIAGAPGVYTAGAGGGGHHQAVHPSPRERGNLRSEQQERSGMLGILRDIQLLIFGFPLRAY